MPRKGEAPRRRPAPDPVFESRVVSLFINYLMEGGKKTTAERVFYGALDLVQERTSQNPLEVFQRALQNVTPEVEVRPRRVGGATYQVPIEVSARRRLLLPIRWLVRAARERNERTMVQRLAGELMDAANREGVAMRRREDVHRMADANKAYAHYRW
ncbi:MAG: 30S ribosomal protein S7 [candidate division WS1 bacterium]|nr:30S ribosomal protein S7 [candidate division WS1 bacterium]